MNLTTLKFDVDTIALENAVKLVDNLRGSVSNLGKPLQAAGGNFETTGKTVVKQANMMDAAVSAFYKNQEKLERTATSQKQKLMAAEATMNDSAVKSYWKHTEEQQKAQVKLTSSLATEQKKQQSILERQNSILGFVSEGFTKGQSSILATAKAAGVAGAEFKELTDTLKTLSKLMGENPFDKSNDGLRAMTVQLGQAREGYRQLTQYTAEYNRLKAEGNGAEVSLVGLNRKETDQLYRDKLRSFELFKQTRDARKQELELELQSGKQTRESINKTLYDEKHLFKERLRAQEAQYKSVATQKRPLDDIRTVDATKRANELRYLARATSVQLGDIGISLAGGQNPLTVFLQQGDQLRGVFNQVGADAVEMKKALSGAFGQIITGFRDVAMKLGEFVGVAFVDAGKWVANFITQLTTLPFFLDKLTNGFKLLGFEFNGLGKDNGFVKFINTISPAVLGGITVGVLGLATVVVGLAIAYAKILPVQKELNAALIQNGASLATSAKEAMQMSAAMAGASGTSLDYAKVITEIASAGNLSKESIQGITTSAVEMNRYLGTATKDVVAQYSKLADDPVKALTEIGMATGRVTSATIDNIRELVEQGKKTEAVTLANKELDRAYAEMSASARENMTPLGKLWDEIKSSVNEAIEAVYSFAQTESVVSTLTDIWRDFADAIKSVLNLAKQAIVIFSAIEKVNKTNAVFSGASIADKMAATKEAMSTIKGALLFDPLASTPDAPKTVKSLTKSQDEYVTSLESGVTVRRKATQAELDALKVNRDQIKARAEIEKMEDKFGTKSVLTATQRLKKISDAKAQVEEQLSKSGLSAQDAELKRKPLYANIEEQFRAKKKGSGSDSAARDALSEKQQSFENERKQAERNAKTRLSELDSARNLELINSYMYIDEKYAIDKEYIEKSIQLLSQEMDIAAKKKNSLKEVAQFQGKIQAEKDKLDDKSLERQRALTEHSGKAAIEMRTAAMQEIATLVEKNKAQQLDNELIGKTQEQIAGIKAARLDHVIALQQEHVEYMKSNGYNNTSSTAYGLEKEKLDALIQSRKLNVDALEREAMATFKGYEKELNPTTIKSEESSLVVGEESKKQAAYNDTARVAIEAAAHIAKSKMDLAMLDESTTQAQLDSYQKIIDSAALMNEELTTKFSQSVKIDGLDKIASQFDSMSKAAGGMGEGFKRATSALGGFSGAFKNLAAAEKNHKKGSNEYIQAQIGGYGDMAGAAAGFFEENSTGYNMMKAAEQGFRAVQLALSIAAMIQGKAETVAVVQDNTVKGTSSMWAGVAKAFEQLGIFGFIGAGAILAFLGSKFGGGGGGSIGTAGAGNQIGADGRKATYGSDDDGEGATNYNRANGRYDLNSKPQLTDAEVKARADAAAIDAAANAVANLRIESMKLTKGSEELEQSLARARLAAGGMGKAQHELATQGMNEAELASYNLNQALRGQISVQMDMANGTSNTSENMKKLAGETRKLAIDLAMASGDIAGARSMQREDDTVGYSKEEVAAYDHIQRQKEQIEAANAGASAAREAAQAEEQLAQARYELAGSLNILLGRTTQLEFDRATQLASTTDAASIEMMKLIFQLEDLASAIDASYATLERSIAAERKLAETRLQSAVALQTILKSAKDATSPKLTRVNAQANLRVLLALAKSSGVLPSTDALAPSLAALREPSEGLFTTFVDYQRDFLKTAKDIDDMSRLADKQVSIEQQTIDKLDAQLTAAKDQLDALKGVDTSVKDVTTAVNDFNKAMQDLANKKASAGNYTYTPPVAGGGSGGGGGGGGSAGGATKPKFEDVVGQTNKDIVAAYREYYNRNPDESGYEFFSKSLLKGDKLMQAILGASAGDLEGADYKSAVSKGYDPKNPVDKYLKSILKASGGAVVADDTGSFAVGINYVPEDMNARIHKGERILPAADNRELFNRLQNPEENAVVLAAAVERLTKEVEGLRMEQRQTMINTGDTFKTLRRLTGEGDALNVRVQA